MIHSFRTIFLHHLILRWIPTIVVTQRHCRSVSAYNTHNYMKYSAKKNS